MLRKSPSCSTMGLGLVGCMTIPGQAVTPPVRVTTRETKGARSMARPICPECNSSNDEGATHCSSCGEPLAAGGGQQLGATATSEAQTTPVTAVEKLLADGFRAMLAEQRHQTEHLKKLGTVGQILLVLMVLGIILMGVALVLGAVMPGL